MSCTWDKINRQVYEGMCTCETKSIQGENCSGKKSSLSCAVWHARQQKDPVLYLFRKPVIKKSAVHLRRGIRTVKRTIDPSLLPECPACKWVFFYNHPS